ncbi:HpcH/HpaI aldolase/citrate lyase family protein [Nocardioides sp. Kera G14]|uniref:HpcH/HpaI aldolase/citrate lyase family protein n=1 Tax=Nocardioides sp. Kera G14 TaxID=2884264 RepID=UPI001D12D2E1|nr:HpcH/HpaI aldolase/citrate lyase family protein [Nocardioides sp. Kera G14]UDY23236.1 HpcH/HpaI aldolase/citrate lyase family protein [Nocardioides sp. Kera G14]
MRHFEFLSPPEAETLFAVPPVAFDRAADRETVADALGATLYSPATRPRLVDDLVRSRARGVVSSVVCLEDSIRDADVESALTHLVTVLSAFAGRADEAPLVFVRVRSPEQIDHITRELGDSADALVGFVLPKFAEDSGGDYLRAVECASERLSRRLWAMPVIETPEVMYAESRSEALGGIARVLRHHRDHVLAVRTGATDLAAVYGLRRPRELTVYDVRVVAAVLTAVVNMLGRPGDEGFVVTGPVWEYYSDSERLFKPQLRETPFLGRDDRALRAQLISEELDGLIREVVLDRANGLVGKTVIHPSHVPVVHALSVVSHEDHSDAVAVLGADAGGAFRSEYGNKMNETNPHRAWAERTVRRARAFGVAAPGVSFVDLLAAVDRG